jgi:predicted amidohydrolase
MITVAAVSCVLRHGDPSANLKQIARWTRAAARERADLVLFNETSATGYWMDERIRRLAEPIDGPTVRELTAIASRNSIVIAAGFVESAGDKQHNTHVLVGPGGLIGYHRKSSLPDGEEKYFDVGDDCNVLDVCGHRVGIAICYESVHPETCRRLAANGAQVILAPYHNAVTPAEIHNGKRPYFTGRARENHIWYVACDQCGYADNGAVIPGAVCFVNPSGEIVAVTPLDEPGEHMIVRELDPVPPHA